MYLNEKADYVALFGIVAYELLIAVIVIPSVTMGTITFHDECLNTSILPTSVWLFVFAGIYMLIQLSSVPLIHLIVNMRTIETITKYHVVFATMSVILIVVSWGWLGLGVHVYFQTRDCAFVHASRLIIAYDLIWLVLLGGIVILGIIMMLYGCIRNKRQNE